jgi:hypothetical protein
MNNKHLIEDITWLYFKQSVMEMANMQPEDTGLKSIVHIMTKGGAKHGPRIKVSNVAGRFAHDDNFTITVEQTPRIVGKSKLKKSHVDDILDWINLNDEHLHNIWHNGDTMRASDIENGFLGL